MSNVHPTFAFVDSYCAPDERLEHPEDFRRRLASHWRAMAQVYEQAAVINSRYIGGDGVAALKAKAAECMAEARRFEEVQ